MTKRLKPCLDIDLTDLPNEVWVSCFAYDGLYEVSNLGRVKSVDRFDSLGRLWKARIRKLANVKSHKPISVTLCQDGVPQPFMVAHLVLNSFGFFGAAEEISVHKNKIMTDNQLVNLKFTSHSESMLLGYSTGAIPKPIRIGLPWKEQEKRDYQEKFVTIIEGKIISKICTVCMMEQFANQYEYNGKCDPRICKICAYKRQGIINVGIRQQIKDLKNAGLIKCTKCETVKPLSDYHANKSKCKKCYVWPKRDRKGPGVNLQSD